MSSLAIPRYLQHAVYIRIGRESLTVRDVRSGNQLKEPPFVAVSEPPGRKVLAAGAEALAMRGREGVAVVNPFAHPRTPISDFTLADALLRAMIRKLGSRRWWAPAPAIVMHLDYALDGGLTRLEVRALKELGMGAGASRCVVWEGPVLSDEQVLTQKFPTTGEVLE